MGFLKDWFTTKTGVGQTIPERKKKNLGAMSEAGEPMTPVTPAAPKKKKKIEVPDDDLSYDEWVKKNKIKTN